MTTYHHLTSSLFTTVGGGGGGPAAIRELHAGQVSKHLLLIGHLLENWPEGAGEPSAVVATLERVRAAAPDTFRDVIGAPLVGAWSGIAARAVEQGIAAPVDFLHLGSLAVVACAAAGLDGSAEVAVHDGLVVLPGLGAVEAPGTETAEGVVEAGRILVRTLGPDGARTVSVPADPTAAAVGWQPVRRLRAETAGLRISLGLDDLHPYRHGHHVPPANRLSEDEVELWQTVFAESWRLLGDRLPERAAELQAGLRTLVPLVQEDARTARSATIRHAFGVFGVTRPASAAEFAVTMVHEFQHSKLSALLDLLPLTDPDDTGRYFAPWRTDPRPLAGLLQGVYAFAGVADTWRALRGVGDAEKRFAEARLQVDRGLTSVERSGGLTPDGEHFAAQLRITTDAMLAEQLAPEAVRAAEQELARTHQAWAERNRP